MEDAYNESDSFKAELEKFKAEIETELSESLKKAHSEQLLKLEEAKKQIEKQSQELKVKYEELAEAREFSKKLESCLQEKELSVRNLSSMHEKVKADFEQKLKNSKGENRDLVSSLDDSTTRNKELEQDVYASSKQIDGLKELLLVTEKKYLEAQQMAQETKELRHRDEMIIKLEDESNNVQDQLKWKKEQFKHLEEAHKRLQDQFEMSKQNWEREKSALIEETSSLQASFNSQTRILEGLQTRLEMCNHALAHEESKRKSLEVQVSDYESRFENSFSQFQEEKLEIQRLFVERNEEIAKLRTTLGTDDTLAKEMEFKVLHLERENEDLTRSLKELQEAQIRNAGITSFTKLHNKLKRLEQVQSNCSAKLEAKESEWLSEIKKIKGNMISYKSELMDTEEQIKKLQMELESYYSAIQVLNEEISIIFAFFKSEISEAYSKTYDVKKEMKLFNKEKEDNISLLTAQLKMSCGALNIAHLELEEEHKKIESLTERVNSSEPMKQRPLLREEELQIHKYFIEDSSVSQFHLKDQLLQMESIHDNDKQDLCGVLEKESAELDAKMNEVIQLECKLENLKSNPDSPDACFGEDQEAYKQMKNCLLVLDETTQIFKNKRESLTHIFEEKDRNLKDLQQHVVLLEGRLAAKAEDMEACLRNKEKLVKIAAEKDVCIENLQKDVAMLKQMSRRRELEAVTLAQLDAGRALPEEKEFLLKLINEKDQTIKSLELLASLLEQELTNAAMSSFSDFIEKQVKIDLLNEALKKGEYVKDLEIEEKNGLIVHLEKELCSLHEKLAHQEDEAEQLQALMKSNKLETESLLDKHRRMEELCKQLEFDKGVLLQDIVKLSIAREKLLAYVQKVCDRVGEFSGEDIEMMEVMGKMLPRSEEEIQPAMELMVNAELYDSIGGNVDTYFSTTSKKLEASSNERSPLKEVN
ncbi:hypothetical protein PanWU01x14_319640 [Parasponia andersonii]|uniref:Uncharacterized protein n=1 Tax=Parasponia andersonii TaxID=3476 RepID=A0A2P5ALT2_PARAD|nr:hypothetical protein PanWU01x14_319640 [Parasponia andersonii]